MIFMIFLMHLKWMGILMNIEIAYVGHTYVIWTLDNQFAKIRIKNINADRIVFDWAFQFVQGEPQLKPVVKGSGERNLDKLQLAR